MTQKKKPDDIQALQNTFRIILYVA